MGNTTKKYEINTNKIKMMKKFLNKTFLQILFLMVIAATSLFSENKKITQMVRLKEVEFTEQSGRQIYIKEKREWMSGFPAIFAIFEVKKDFSDSNFFMKAYFYNEDNKVLGVSDKATAGNRTSSRGYDTIFTTPTEFKKGEEYVVHFRPPQNVDVAAIKRVLVVYGTSEMMGAKADPNVSLDSLEFDEKAKLVETSEE